MESYSSYLNQRLTRVCMAHLVKNSFMTYHQIFNRVFQQVQLVEQELVILLEHLSSSPVFNWGSYCSIFCFLSRSLLDPLTFFLLAIVLSVKLQFMVSNYPFGIIKTVLIKLFLDFPYSISLF